MFFAVFRSKGTQNPAVIREDSHLVVYRTSYLLPTMLLSRGYPGLLYACPEPVTSPPYSFGHLPLCTISPHHKINQDCAIHHRPRTVLTKVQRLYCTTHSIFTP